MSLTTMQPADQSVAAADGENTARRKSAVAKRAARARRPKPATGKLRDRFWTPTEFADEMGRSLSSVYEAIKAGQLPCVELGRMKYIPKTWGAKPAPQQPAA
jgi:hypothetical protein